MTRKVDSGGGGKMCSAVNFTFKIMLYSEYVDFMMSEYNFQFAECRWKQKLHTKLWMTVQLLIFPNSKREVC